jgi:hypothetical protein
LQDSHGTEVCLGGRKHSTAHLEGRRSSPPRFLAFVTRAARLPGRRAGRPNLRWLLLVLLLGFASPASADAYRGAFVYERYPEGWTQGGIFPYSHHTPTIGFYDSSDPTVIRSHLARLDYARFDVAIASWRGPGTPSDDRIPALLYETRATASNVKWAVHYQEEGYANPTPAEIAADLDYVSAYASDPAYMRIDGRPVLFVFGNAESCEMADRWAGERARFHVVLKVFGGWETCTSQPDSWHQYGITSRTSVHLPHSYLISPGYWKATDATPRLPRATDDEWAETVKTMVASNATWQLVSSLNEWGKGTSIEPATEWVDPSCTDVWNACHGRYLDILRWEDAQPPPPPPPPPPAEAKLEIKTFVLPVGDLGRFDLQIDGATVKADAMNAESTGEQVVLAGSHSVGAAAGTGTSLAHYTSEIRCREGNGSGAVIASSTNAGPITLGLDVGDDVVCRIINTREPPSARLEIKTFVLPVGDLGRFDLQIDGATVRDDAMNGETTGEQVISAGSHTVGEIAGAGTNLSHYTSEIRCREGNGGGAVVASSKNAGPLTVTLVEDADVVCRVINTRRPPAKLEVRTLVLPAGDPGRFHLQIDGTTVKADAASGESSGEQVVTAGEHTVGELAGSGTSLFYYTSEIRCRKDNGSGPVIASATNAGPLTVTLEPDADVLCRMINTRKSTGDPRIGAAGDIACASNVATSGGCHQATTSDLLAGYDAVLPLGDLQYPNGELENFNAFYDPSWGRFKSITRPTPGNHEYNTAEAAGYFAYWGNPPPYYSYDLGLWHLISLNSSISMATGSAQDIWLKEDLATHPNACTLAYWHHPRFNASEGRTTRSAQLPAWQALYDNGADVVLNGHDHVYDRKAPMAPDGTLDSTRGLRQFVVGTGGKDITSLDPARLNSEFSQDTAFGILELTLRPAGYDWRFRVDDGITSMDEGQGACH